MYAAKAILITIFEIESLKPTSYIGTKRSYAIPLERHSLTRKSSMDRQRKGADYRTAKEAATSYTYTTFTIT